MESCIAHLLASPQRLDMYRSAQKSDPVCSLVSKYCQNGWPGKNGVDEVMRPYWEVRGELSMHHNLLLFGSRIVVPASMQQETLGKLHQGHQGIQRYHLRARTSVWWPGLSKQIEKPCETLPSVCERHHPAQGTTDAYKTPRLPLAEGRIGPVRAERGNINYLIVVDYFSRFPEAIKLTSVTSQSVITALKSVFSRYGIPEVLVSDNGPQFTS